MCVSVNWGRLGIPGSRSLLVGVGMSGPKSLLRVSLGLSSLQGLGIPSKGWVCWGGRDGILGGVFIPGGWHWAYEGEWVYHGVRKLGGYNGAFTPVIYQAWTFACMICIIMACIVVYGGIQTWNFLNYCVNLKSKNGLRIYLHAVFDAISV